MVLMYDKNIRKIMVPWAGLNLNLTTNLYLMFVNRFNIYLFFLDHYKAREIQFTSILYSVYSQQRLSLFLA